MQDTQVLISTIDYNEYVGRIGVGKVESGTIRCKSGAYSSEPPRSGQKTARLRSASFMSLTV